MFSNIQPNAVWQNFEALNAIPRASKKEQQVIAFIKQFGANLNLYVYQDEVGNVIIKKPATVGLENRPAICLQSHLDMVHQKNNDTVFNFATEGIKMYIDGDWVKAQGTTLGADNGLGVASIMTILASTNIAHPAIEALFTIDEETGMTGALALKGGLLNAKYMLNLDTEDDNELTIGCAGGIDVTAVNAYVEYNTPPNTTSFLLNIKGLTGGHSGIDIHKGRANANKLMNRLLQNLRYSFTIHLSSIDGGSLRNAIPRESKATIAIENINIKNLETEVAAFEAKIKKEFQNTDPNITITLQQIEQVKTVCSQKFLDDFLFMVYELPDGVYTMDPNIEGLVQTSNNVARIFLGNNNYSIQCLTRSSVNEEKMELAKKIETIFRYLTYHHSFGGNYPGWAPNPNSHLVRFMVAKYKALHNNQAPLVNACHAGLECGILGTNYPQMQIISFGPTIHGAHSPDEKVSITSVQKFWNYLLEVLKNLE